MTSRLQVGDLVLWMPPSTLSYALPSRPIGMVISACCSGLRPGPRQAVQVFWFKNQNIARHSNGYLARLETTNDK